MDGIERMDEQADLQRKASAILRDLDEAEFMLNRQIAVAEKEMKEGREAMAELHANPVRRALSFVAGLFRNR